MAKLKINKKALEKAYGETALVFPVVFVFGVLEPSGKPNNFAFGEWRSPIKEKPYHTIILNTRIPMRYWDSSFRIQSFMNETVWHELRHAWQWEQGDRTPSNALASNYQEYLNSDIEKDARDYSRRGNKRKKIFKTKGVRLFNRHKPFPLYVFPNNIIVGYRKVEE